MITTISRLQNKLESCVTFDKKDKSIVRVNLEQVFHYLEQSGIIVPPRQFEESLQKILDEYLVNATTADFTVKVMIARILISLASTMHVSKDVLEEHK